MSSAQNRVLSGHAGAITFKVKKFEEGRIVEAGFPRRGGGVEESARTDEGRGASPAKWRWCHFAVSKSGLLFFNTLFDENPLPISARPAHTRNVSWRRQADAAADHGAGAATRALIHMTG